MLTLGAACPLGLFQGDHHQDGEADGRAGGHGHGYARLAALPAEDHEPNPTGESTEQLEEPTRRILRVDECVSTRIYAYSIDVRDKVVLFPRADQT